MKKNTKLLILTTAVILIPILAGLFLWDRLPAQIPTHWNAEGVIDDWSSKEFAVFGLFGIMAGLHLLCYFGTMLDPKNKGHNEKTMWIVLWICPILSVLLGTLMYCAAFGMEVNMERIMPIVIGAIFVVIGNYMPKFKQNSTMGIKIPWTLADEANWNATHRFGGIAWVIGGVLMMITGILGNVWIMVAAMIVLAFVPMVYSYLYYRKHGVQER